MFRPCIVHTHQRVQRRTRPDMPLSSRHTTRDPEQRPRREGREVGEWCAFCDIVFESVVMKWLSLCSLTRCLGAWCMGPCRIKLMYKSDASEQIMTLLIAYQSRAAASQRIFMFVQKWNENENARDDSKNSSWNLTLGPIINSIRPIFPRGALLVAWMVREKNLRRKSFE